jgi:hypothetical protein
MGNVATQTASSNAVQLPDQHSCTGLLIRRFGVRIPGSPTSDQRFLAGYPEPCGESVANRVQNTSRVTAHLTIKRREESAKVHL